MKQAPYIGWNAVILAGGRSTRMGRDKALLRWGDSTLLAHMHALLQDAGAEEIVVSGDRPAFGGVPDRRAGTGPMGALAQLLPHLRDGNWIVVPVDMPLLSADLLHALGRTQGRCACIAQHALPMLLRLDTRTREIVSEIGGLSGRACSFRALQQRLDAVELAAEAWGDALSNCNTPEEWASLSRTVRKDTDRETPE